METPSADIVIQLGAALAIGFLIGTERERHKGQNSNHEIAGVRTFTLTALCGAVSLHLGDITGFAVFGLVIGALIVASYRKTREYHPGLTTEIAQIATYLMGGLAMREPQLAAGLGVVVAILLAARTRLHDWIHNALTDEEIRDGLMLAAAALVILPLTPIEAIDPWDAIRPRQLWTLAVIVMTINGMGYIALRVLGPRIGLALAGFFSGFVSSTATIGAMADRARRQPELRNDAVAGATISSVASIVQLAIVIGLVNVVLLRELAVPLLAAGAVATVYAGVLTLRNTHTNQAAERSQRDAPGGRPFDPGTAMIFVAVVGAALLISAVLTQWLGDRGLLIATAVGGFADAHAPAISAATLVANGTVMTRLAALAVLAALTTNAVSKMIVAFTVGDRSYALQLAPGITLSLLAAWAGFALQGLSA